MRDVSRQRSAFSVVLISVTWVLATHVMAGEIVFLQDGRTIQADKAEVIGDWVRIERPAELIELPRSAVLSIHPMSPSRPSPNVPPPAEVYRGLTHQMTDKVRREIRERPDVSRAKSP
jgi:hypothetical protein